jgi:hypothetical protein
MVKKNQKLQKLSEWIDIWCNDKNVRGIKKPPLLVIYELMAIVNDENKKTTINRTTVGILQRADIKVKPEGIGWRFRK